MTQEVDRALQKYIIIGNSFSYLFLSPSPLIREVKKYYIFYKLVKDEAPWDIKLMNSWEKTIGTPFPGEGTIIRYHGIYLTPEGLGNYTYGVLGRAFGITLDVLLAGSYYAAHFPTSSGALDNELRDWVYIIQGYFAGYR